MRQFYRLDLFVIRLKTGCLVYIMCNDYQVYHIYFRRSFALNTHIQLENVQLFTDDQMCIIYLGTDMIIHVSLSSLMNILTYFISLLFTFYISDLHNTLL